MILSRRHLQSGYTLVEALVAVGILTSVLLGVLLLAVQSIRATNVSQTKLQAEYLAQEGIELVRGMREGGTLFGPKTYADLKTFLQTHGSVHFNVDAAGHVCFEDGAIGGPVCADASNKPFGTLLLDSGQNDQFVVACDTAQQGTTCTPTNFIRTLTLEPDSSGAFYRVTSRVQYAVVGFSNPLSYTLTTDLYNVAQ